MRIYILIITLCCFGSSLADEQANHTLTNIEFDTVLKSIVSNGQSVIADKGSYLLITDNKSQKFFAFTKPSHVAHPGYIQWSIRVEDGAAILDALGKHGNNGKEFHIFEKQMNDVMVNNLKK